MIWILLFYTSPFLLIGFVEFIVRISFWLSQCENVDLDAR